MLESNLMKRLVFLSSLLFAMCAFAQTPVEISAEPHHHLVFENQYFRVFDVIVPPNIATLMHQHRHDYFFVTLGDTDISNQIANWNPPAPIELRIKDGETRFAPGNFAHLVRDLAKTPFRNITIEYLQDQQAHQAPPVAWNEERGVHVLDGGTEEILFVKDGIRVSETELQPKAVFPARASFGQHLLVAVTDLDLRPATAAETAAGMHSHQFAEPQSLPSKPEMRSPSSSSHAPRPAQSSAHLRMKSGDVKWFEGGPSQGVVNVARTKARFVILELH
ncbi:MAG TPA: hypothetical protein VFA68_00125 [Terriglobales bacterium]|nr:hypothetical protein [Terriglobales bacterium]